MSRKRRPEPDDPSAFLAGACSCLDCGLVIRCVPGIGPENPSFFADLGPILMASIEEVIGCEWELKQGLGSGGGLHWMECPPGRGVTTKEVAWQAG